MGSKIIIGNFKAELSNSELEAWFQEALALYSQTKFSDGVVVGVAPSFIHLEKARELITKYNMPFLLGAQNVSALGNGPFTGDTPVSDLKGLVDFIIVGHSERRKYHGETVESIQQKISLLNEENIKVVLCTEKIEKYEGTLWALAYEPESAIGTGVAAPVFESIAAADKIREITPAEYLLYGGSSSAETVQEFIQSGFNGVLVGKKSIHPSSFFQIIQNA